MRHLRTLRLAASALVLLLLTGLRCGVETSSAPVRQVGSPGLASDDAGDRFAPTGVLNAAFVVTETVFNSELMAPYDILHHTKFRDPDHYIRPFIVSPDGGPFETFEGLTVAAHYDFDDSPEVDILVIPSTDGSMSSDLQNTAYLDWIRRQAEGARYVISLCDGAFPLAATGLLDGRAATTFPADRKRLAESFPAVDVRDDVHLVIDGKYVTSSGGARSYEPALYVVEQLYSADSARRTAQGLVIDWALKDVPHLDMSKHRNAGEQR